MRNVLKEVIREELEGSSVVNNKGDDFDHLVRDLEREIDKKILEHKISYHSEYIKYNKSF